MITSPHFQVIIYWIDHNYKEYNHFINMEQRNCLTAQFDNTLKLFLQDPYPVNVYEGQLMPPLGTNACFNYSEMKNKNKQQSIGLRSHHYYIAIDVTRKPLYCTDYTEIRQEILSWNKVSAMCKRTGGTLPVFRSRAELDEFLAVLKPSPYRYDDKWKRIICRKLSNSVCWYFWKSEPKCMHKKFLFVHKS